MDMDLNSIRIFTKVVQAGSFSAAGRLLGVPKSTISFKVAQLEEALGVTLLKRTTKKLHLTEAGQHYYPVCNQALTALEEAGHGATLRQLAPRGLLRVTAPGEFSSLALAEAIDRFVDEHREIEVDLLLTDRIVDLVAENVDIAIRAGELADSSLIAKKLGTSTFQVYASPSYVKTQGRPKTPQDLARHSCVHFTALGNERVWEMRCGSKRARVKVGGRVQSNDLIAVKAFALLGRGLAFLPGLVCQDDVRTGKLVRLLEDWRADSDPINLVYPAQKFVPPKTKAFVEFAHKHLQKLFS